MLFLASSPQRSYSPSDYSFIVLILSVKRGQKTLSRSRIKLMVYRQTVRAPIRVPLLFGAIKMMGIEGER